MQDAFGNHHNVHIMASRLFALIAWAAVAASLAFWGLRWIARPTGVPSNASSVALDGGAHGDMHRLLAGPAPTVPGVPAADAGAASALAARLKLLGVVAPRSGTDQGVALMSIDGKPPRAVRVGGVVDGEMTAQMRPVKIGVRLTAEVEITSGLQAGEKVIVEGSNITPYLPLPEVKPGPRPVAPPSSSPTVSTPTGGTR